MNDDTVIKFEDKLIMYLGSVLIGDEMADRVRAAFDAYVFLSYRKKDRKYGTITENAVRFVKLLQKKLVPLNQEVIWHLFTIDWVHCCRKWHR